MNELPGMGGVNDNTNFQMNCSDWTKLFENSSEKEKAKILSIKVMPSQIYAAPITGAVQNIGFTHEADFYLPYFSGAYNAGCGICAGDGTPDQKLMLGIESIKFFFERAAFFIKPYPLEKMIERANWTQNEAHIIGTDIDAYAIATMRDLVNLEKPTAKSLKEFRKHFSVPFAIKGVFTDESIQLVKDVKPEIAYISNHGGRVDTRVGSTAEFLAEHAKELRPYCNEIWVDGGIRTHRDVQTAIFYGASKVAIGRPLITALISGFDVPNDGVAKMTERLREFIGE